MTSRRLRILFNSKIVEIVLKLGRRLAKQMPLHLLIGKLHQISSITDEIAAVWLPSIFGRCIHFIRHCKNNVIM